MTSVTLARRAMATRFEMVLWGENPISLRAAGEEALNEIERLEGQLSLYRSTSDVRRINTHAADRPVRVDPLLFQLLQHCKQLSDETRGAFDITVAPLMKCWGFVGGTGSHPSPEQIEQARSIVGMNRVILDEAEFTVRFERRGMMLDFGAIGKGYAIARAVESLVENGIISALVHGGTSTVYGLGVPGDGSSDAGWKIAIDAPNSGVSQEAANTATPPILTTVILKDSALSVSARHGKAFTSNGTTYGHVIDPRSGYPAQGAVLAAVILPSITETDALSTALLTLGVEEQSLIAELRPDMQTLAVAEKPGSSEFEICASGGFPVLPLRDKD